MCSRVSIIPGSEVSVKRSDNCVLLPLFHISPEKTEYVNYWTPEKYWNVFVTITAPVPLSNAGSTGIGQDYTPNIVEDLWLKEEIEKWVFIIPTDEWSGGVRKRLTYPSLSIVARICSDPGVTVNWALHFRPLSKACLATEAARPISS